MKHLEALLGCFLKIWVWVVSKPELNVPFCETCIFFRMYNSSLIFQVFYKINGGSNKQIKQTGSIQFCTNIQMAYREGRGGTLMPLISPTSDVIKIKIPPFPGIFIFFLHPWMKIWFQPTIVEGCNAMKHLVQICCFITF